MAVMSECAVCQKPANDPEWECGICGKTYCGSACFNSDTHDEIDEDVIEEDDDE